MFASKPTEEKTSQPSSDEKKLVDNSAQNPYLNMYVKEKVDRKQVRQFLKPYIFHKDSMPLFYSSMVLLVGSKSLAIASPYILKTIVDSMTLAGSVDFYTSALGIAAFGLTRVVSTIFQEYRMIQIARFIQQGVKRVSQASFQHLHSLDMNFHKVSSKNTVFAINRAIRSIESGMRFAIGFFSPIAFEFILLCGMLQFYCGPAYLANMIGTLGLYAYFTKVYSKKRIVQIR